MSPDAESDAAFSCIKAAARAVALCPQRKGNVVHLRAGAEVMVTGDLHADVASFERIVAIAALDRNPSRHLVLQELVHSTGSAAGKADSCALVESVALLITLFPDRVHLLMGNHEMAELTGRVIMKESVVLNQVFANEAAARYGARADEAIAYFKAFWRALPLAVRTEGRVFISHSTPSRAMLERFDASVLARPLEERDLERNGSAYALLWGRDFRQETADALSEVLDADVFVVGHTPCPEGFAVPNTRHVILDSQGHSGKYVVVPTDGALTSGDIAGRIRSIWP